MSAGQFTCIENVPVAGDKVRRTCRILMDINESSADTAYLVKLSRDATNGNANDTLSNAIVLTHIKVNAYFWKP